MGAPFAIDASNKMVDRQEKCMAGDDCYVQREEDEEFLVVLADAVVYPGAVVVHLADAPLAHTAVVRPLRLEAAALGALVHQPALPQAQLLHGLARRRAPGHRTRVCDHSADVREDGQKGEQFKKHQVEGAVVSVQCGQEDDAHHHILGVQHQQPRHEGADNAADVPHKPEAAATATHPLICRGGHAALLLLLHGDRQHRPNLGHPMAAPQRTI